MTLLEVHEKMRSNKTLVKFESKRDTENAKAMFAENTPVNYQNFKPVSGNFWRTYEYPWKENILHS